MLPAPPPPPADDQTTTIVGTGTVTMPTAEHAVNDTLTVRFVVVLIGAIVLTAIGCLTGIALSGVEVSEGITASLSTLASTGVGALGAMLASTASKRT